MHSINKKSGVKIKFSKKIILFLIILLSNISCSQSNKKVFNEEILNLESEVSPMTAYSMGEPSAAILFFLFDLNSKIKFTLNNKEIKMHTDAIFFALNNSKIGEIITWNNQERYASGKTRVVASYYRDKEYCRVLQSYIILNGAEKHKTKNICLLNKEWKFD